ncbi:unnamed protein product [Adineta steineri]|uniref:WD repeat-containing protein 37 n=1 Tax=Adineta steineri TaxID=433720 RepID=A0A814JLV3_9BILA|nr:unnamed protein product [Adineta steineri]CAF1266110.1 unnamed protein product [Adineta steineri]
MSDRRQRIYTVLNKCATMIGETSDPLNSSIDTSNIDPLLGVTNICLSSLENPSASKVRLRQLLRQVEKEFEAVLVENIALRKELERYGGLNNNNNNTHVTTTSKLRAANIFPMIRNRVVLRTGNQSDDLMFSSTNQHQDVIWDVQVGGLDDRYFGSASADKTSVIWSRKTGRSLIQYQGHRGSVNSCRFGYFDHDLVLTASGDHEVHIWKCSLDENKDDEDEDNEMNTQIIRSPLLALRGDDVLSCADWLQRDQIVSASWDRSATLWQVETGTSLRTLYGHDGELTYVSCHQTKPLVITSSRDGTFRLWDCRTPSPSVQIFNGHTKAVNSALFLGNDRLVSSSDDGFVHIWDSRSTSCSPLISLECVSPCNRISLSHDILAIPLDNRDIRLYSAINGDKLHVQRRAHTRAVQCTALVQCGNSMEFLLASGSLDRHMHVWHIKKLKGTNNNKLMKSLDDSIGSPTGSSFNETNKNGNGIDGQNKKANKRTPLTEKANNLGISTDKKQMATTSNITSDKQSQRTLSTLTK